MTEFKPGLEGVVAFETEIAEPDRDGGALRYRGVDIEELVGSVPFEQVWGLLVDDAPEPGLPPSEEYAARDLTGRTPSDLQTVTARLGGEWGLGQLIDISDDQARTISARLSATIISIVAQSARLADGHADPVDPALIAEGETAAERFLLEWRGEADPEGRHGDRHVLDLHRRARPERLDVHGKDRRVDGRRLRRRAVVRRGRALRPAPWRGAGAGLPMLDGAAAAPLRRGLREDLLDRGDRLMGFGHRVYRAEDPRARLLRRTAKSSARRGSTWPRSSSASPSRSCTPASPIASLPRTSSSGRQSSSTSRTCRRSSRRRCSRAREPPAGRPTSSSRSGSAGWCGRRRGTSVPPLGRSPPSSGARGGRSPRRGAHPDAGERAGARDSACPMGRRARGRRAQPGLPDPRHRRSGRSGSFASARSSSCSGGGSRTRAPRPAGRR